MDLAGMTDSDLHQLIDSIQAQLAANRAALEQEKAEIIGSIGESVGVLDALIGTLNPARPPLTRVQAGDVTIREMRTFTAAELGVNAGLALRLILGGLEELAVTTRNIAATR